MKNLFQSASILFPRNFLWQEMSSNTDIATESVETLESVNKKRFLEVFKNIDKTIGRLDITDWKRMRIKNEIGSGIDFSNKKRKIGVNGFGFTDEVNTKIGLIARSANGVKSIILHKDPTGLFNCSHIRLKLFGNTLLLSTAEDGLIEDPTNEMIADILEGIETRENQLSQQIDEFLEKEERETLQKEIEDDVEAGKKKNENEKNLEKKL